MTAADGEPPLAGPPADFGRIKLPFVELPAGALLYRIHRLINDPVWFGIGSDPTNRFDDPLREYGVCYFGRSRESAFAETMLRRPPVRLLSRFFLDERGMAECSLRRPLRLVQAYGTGLARLGATAAIASGIHEASRRWSRVLWEHASSPDGIQYRCRHDDDGLAVALYDRAADALSEERRFGIRSDTVWFGSVLDRYHLGLDD